LEHEEELVLLVVLVPVEVALENAEPDDGVVHRRERLVEPGVMRRGLGTDVDVRKLAVLVVEVDVVVVHAFSFRRGRTRSYESSIRSRTSASGASPPIVTVIQCRLFRW